MSAPLLRTFSLSLRHGSVCDQKRSGRCWIYASLNPLRQKICEKYGCADFFFSTNHIYYFDQLEKSRAFLARMLELRELPQDSPALSALLREPISSVGQWSYFASLAKRHGLVPLEAMPDTPASADGTRLTRALGETLRLGAYRIRRGETAAATLTEIEGLLREALGTPPTDFLWNETVFTPLSFLREAVGADFGQYVMLMHHPSDRWPVNRAYHEQADPKRREPLLTMLSVEADTLKALALRQLREGEQVVIGCDVRHAANRAAGELSTERYGAPKLAKSDAIAYREICACHVMSIDGRDDDGRWRVQDSHGAETGPDGHYVMTDDWFDAYVLSAVVQKRYLPPALQKELCTPAFMPKTERF